MPKFKLTKFIHLLIYHYSHMYKKKCFKTSYIIFIIFILHFENEAHYPTCYMHRTLCQLLKPAKLGTSNTRQNYGRHI
mgnify:CR=1 FL=1